MSVEWKPIVAPVFQEAETTREALINPDKCGLQAVVMLGKRDINVDSLESELAGIKTRIDNKEKLRNEKLNKSSMLERDNYWEGEKNEFKGQGFDNQLKIYFERTDKILNKFREDAGNKEILDKLGIDNAKKLYTDLHDKDKHDGDVSSYSVFIAKTLDIDELRKIQDRTVSVNKTNGETGEKSEMKISLIEALGLGEKTTKALAVHTEGIKNLLTDKDEFVKNAKDQTAGELLSEDQDLLDGLDERSQEWDAKLMGVKPEKKLTPTENAKKEIYEAAESNNLREAFTLIDDTIKILNEEKNNSNVVKNTIEETSANIKEYKREQEIVFIPENQRKIVVGDIHGDLSGLKKILEDSQFIENMISGDKQSSLIFTGHIIGGNKSLEVLKLIMKLKNLYPKNVTFIKGAKEILYKDGHTDLNDKTSEFFELNETQVKNLFSDRFNGLFENMPSMVITADKGVIVHGGPVYGEPKLGDLLDMDEKRKGVIFDDIMTWAVPVDENIVESLEDDKGKLHERLEKILEGNDEDDSTPVDYKAVDENSEVKGGIGYLRKIFKGIQEMPGFYPNKYATEHNSVLDACIQGVYAYDEEGLSKFLDSIGAKYMIRGMSSANGIFGDRKIMFGGKLVSLQSTGNDSPDFGARRPEGNPKYLVIEYDSSRDKLNKIDLKSVWTENENSENLPKDLRCKVVEFEDGIKTLSIKGKAGQKVEFDNWPNFYNPNVNVTQEMIIRTNTGKDYFFIHDKHEDVAYLVDVETSKNEEWLKYSYLKDSLRIFPDIEFGKNWDVEDLGIDKTDEIDEIVLRVFDRSEYTEADGEKNEENKFLKYRELIKNLNNQANI